jgi:hypothetical protein
MKPGIYYNMPAEDYFKIPAFSKSQIHATMKSARHLKHYLETQHEPSDAKTLGSFVDAMILEPSEINNFAVNPEGIDRRTKAGKEAYAVFLEESEGKEIITQSMYDYAQFIAKSVKEHKAAINLIEGKKQVAVVWIDEATGVLCKGRYDVLNKGNITDLKTTRDASIKAFSRDLVNYGYHQQAAMYLDAWAALNGGEVLKWNFVCVENKAPYCTAVYELDEEAIECGRIRYHIALKRYARYLKDDPDFLQGYSMCIEPISIPSWEIELAFKEGDENDIGI